MTGRRAGTPVGLGPDDRSGPAGRGFALVLGDALEAFRDAEPAVLDGHDPDALHDYRVALRRARTILAAGAAVFPPEELDLLRALTAELGSATTAVRDLDVLAESFDELVEGLSAPLGPGAAALREEIVRLRDREHAALIERIRAEPHAVMLRRWHVMASVQRVGGSDPGPAALRPLGEVAAGLIEHRHRRLIRGGTRRAAGDDPVGWHETRKRLKALRYLVDAFGPLFDEKAVAPLLRELRKLQDRFGVLQDHVVQAELIGRIGVELGGDAALAAGALVDRLHREVEGDIARCRTRLTRLERPKVHAALVAITAEGSAGGPGTAG